MDISLRNPPDIKEYTEKKRGSQEKNMPVRKVADMTWKVMDSMRRF